MVGREKLTPETHANYLVFPNAQKVIFELSACNERAENKLAVRMFTVCKSRLDPKIQATEAGKIYFVSVKDHATCIFRGNKQNGRP